MLEAFHNPQGVAIDTHAKRISNRIGFSKEKDPIKMDYNGKTVSIIRKLPEELPINFKEKTISINDEETSALYNEKLKLTIVYVLDEEGNYNYYIFEQNQLKEKFITLSSNGINIYLKTSEKKIKDLKPAILKLNNEEIKCFQIKENSKYYIIYGTDTHTNKSNYYSYDSVNKTLQLFNEKDYLHLLNNTNKLKLPLYVLTGSTIILILVIVLQSNNQKKYKKIEKSKETKNPQTKKDKKPQTKETKKTKKD